MRRIGPVMGAAWLLIALTAQAYADTQGSSEAAPSDRNLWIAVIVLVLLVGSLIVVRPRPRR